MLRRALVLVAVAATCALGTAAPALALGPSTISVGPLTMGNPGCC
jgi:hypothetical protein